MISLEQAFNDTESAAESALRGSERPDYASQGAGAGRKDRKHYGDKERTEEA